MHYMAFKGGSKCNGLRWSWSENVLPLKSVLDYDETLMRLRTDSKQTPKRLWRDSEETLKDSYQTLKRLQRDFEVTSKIPKRLQYVISIIIYCNFGDFGKISKKTQKQFGTKLWFFGFATHAFSFSMHFFGGKKLRKDSKKYQDLPSLLEMSILFTLVAVLQA